MPHTHGLDDNSSVTKRGQGGEQPPVISKSDDEEGHGGFVSVYAIRNGRAADNPGEDARFTFDNISQRSRSG